MAINLCIDIGNTYSKVAVFENRKMIFVQSYRRFGVSILDKLIKLHTPTHAIISSTRKRNNKLIKRLNDSFFTIVLDHLTGIPFNNTYASPETLGMDRLAAIAGAINKYKNENIFVADLGTCVTFDFVDKDKNYIGGNIAPGLQMRINAMHNYTASLPKVDPYINSNIMGKTTEEALQNGASWGIILEIKSYIRYLNTKYGKINVILTGGDTSFFAEYFKKKIFAEPNLVLYGLNEIILHNAE